MARLFKYQWHRLSFWGIMLGSALGLVWESDSGLTRMIQSPQINQKRARVEHIFRDKWAALPAFAHAVPVFSRFFVAECERHGFDPFLILGLVDVESSFNPNAVSRVGAQGLLQVRPATARAVLKWIPPEERPLSMNLLDPWQNLRIALYYLDHLRAQYGEEQAFHWLAAYLIGPARFNEVRSRPGYQPSETAVYYRRVMRKSVIYGGKRSI